MKNIKYILSIILTVLVVFLIAIALPYGCSQPDKATEILIQSGYTDVEITGWRPFMAGKDDSFSTGFRAKSPNGTEVTGAVTGGWFKGNTIRLD